MPVVMERLNAANAFINDEGMTRQLEMSVVHYEDERKPDYSIKIPKHVFHAVEHEVILKELGIK